MKILSGMPVILPIVFWGVFTGNAFAQPAFAESSDSGRGYSVNTFENVFEQIVAAAENNFQDIITQETFDISGDEFKKISIAFPEAMLAGYRYSQLKYPVFDIAVMSEKTDQGNLVYRRGRRTCHRREWTSDCLQDVK